MLCLSLFRILLILVVVRIPFVAHFVVAALRGMLRLLEPRGEDLLEPAESVGREDASEVSTRLDVEDLCAVLAHLVEEAHLEVEDVIGRVPESRLGHLIGCPAAALADWLVPPPSRVELPRRLCEDHLRLELLPGELSLRGARHPLEVTADIVRQPRAVEREDVHVRALAVASVRPGIGIGPLAHLAELGGAVLVDALVEAERRGRDPILVQEGREFDVGFADVIAVVGLVPVGVTPPAAGRLFPIGVRSLPLRMRVVLEHPIHVPARGLLVAVIHRHLAPCGRGPHPTEDMRLVADHPMARVAIHRPLLLGGRWRRRRGVRRRRQPRREWRKHEIRQLESLRGRHELDESVAARHEVVTEPVGCDALPVLVRSPPAVAVDVEELVRSAHALVQQHLTLIVPHV